MLALLVVARPSGSENGGNPDPGAANQWVFTCMYDVRGRGMIQSTSLRALSLSLSFVSRTSSDMLSPTGSSSHTIYLGT